MRVTSLKLLIVALGFIGLGLANAQSFSGQYIPAKTPKLRELQLGLQDVRSMERIAAGLSSTIKLANPIALVSAECGSVNAYYVPDQRAVVLCVELFHHIKSATFANLEGESTSDDGNLIAVGAVLFALCHELGHALIDQLSLPVLGREEDAADQIGLFLLLNSPFPFHSTMGALWFFDQPHLTFTQRHFASRHSLDPQRQSNLACWAYGSDPLRFKLLLAMPFLPRERATGCEREYRQLESSVRRLLAGHLLLPSAR